MCLGHEGTLQNPSGWLSHPGMLGSLSALCQWPALGLLILQEFSWLEPRPSLPLPPRGHRTALGSSYKVPAHSAEQGQIIICGLLAVGAFTVSYVCTLPLLTAPHLPVPPSAPAASHEGSDWLSQLRETGDRESHRGTPEQVSCVPGNAVRHRGCPRSSNPLSNSIVLE